MVRHIKNWNSIRKKALGTTMFGGQGMHVHHIKRYTDGGSNRQSNLIPLPPTVHREVHKADNDLKEMKKTKEQLRFWSKRSM